MKWFLLRLNYFSNYNDDLCCDSWSFLFVPFLSFSIFLLLKGSLLLVGLSISLSLFLLAIKSHLMLCRCLCKMFHMCHSFLSESLVRKIFWDFFSFFLCYFSWTFTVPLFLLRFEWPDLRVISSLQSFPSFNVRFFLYFILF